jgi:hypothetical protein
VGSALPAFAGSVYVPIVDLSGTNGSSHTTEVWVSNSGTADQPFKTVLLSAGTDGTKRPADPPQTTVQAGRTFLLNGVSAAGQVGLLEINAGAKLQVEARLSSAAPNGGPVSFTSIPVISSENLVLPNQEAHLLGLERDAVRGNFSSLSVVNLGKESAQCEIKVFRSNGNQIAATAVITLLPLSLRQFTDALGLLGEQNIEDARLRVACNKQFYAFATLFNASTSHYTFINPSASGASTLTPPGDDGPVEAGAILFKESGLLHVPTPANQKRTIDIPVPRSLALRSMIVDVDFIPGPWNTLRQPGNHAIIWIHRNVGSQEFRSNSIVNVNAFGPSKYTIKMNQNVDMPARTQTVAEKGVTLVQGQLYHLRYVYDAENGVVTATVTSNGAEVTSLQMAATANNRRLVVNPNALRAEFGHFNFQAHEGPELASFGWQYLNLQVQMIPYD